MLEAEPALLSCQDGQFVGGNAVAVAASFAAFIYIYIDTCIYIYNTYIYIYCKAIAHDLQ